MGRADYKEEKGEKMRKLEGQLCTECTHRLHGEYILDTCEMNPKNEAYSDPSASYYYRICSSVRTGPTCKDFDPIFPDAEWIVELKKVISENPEITLDEIAHHFGSWGGGYFPEATELKSESNKVKGSK